ncbi:DUF4270 domain-containing protein [Flavobacterium caseinilyticum]|uniref:DUF4270 domain-containing protein n=1 Tax=Flavobacterium caseinilyticum TaxID=2541732 RepID=A0A4R5B0L3_9FLAO|nr:DUF4270 domain-containing protein [Flavobacterium caseinilyticum]TDD78089.1 DUF4270 domain-containing protein [Flavobacterium caseinilyticum]
MYNNSFLKKILVVLSIVFLYSCDKDYNEIGGDLIGENNFDFNKVTYDVLGYNQKTGPIQSNNLEVNPLGILNDPNFGETTANFGAQVNLPATVTTISTNPHVESVVLTIPYYYDASKTVTKADGSNVYILDSIYGPEKAQMKLSVYESGYYMRDTDPVSGFQQPQKYFTDQNTDFNNVKVSNRLNDDSNASQNDAFFFDPAEHVVTSTDSITKVVSTVRTPPGMQLNLNKGYFKTRIIDGAIAGKLATNDIFKEYFRGLYFKMEKSGNNPGNLAMINFKAGKITIKYNEDLSTTTGTTTVITRVKKTIVLNMTGNTVSLLSNNFSTSGLAYNALPITGNTTDGDDKLYLKGGEGSVAVLSLFNTPGQLQIIRNSGWLINEANLVFHIDAAAMANSAAPQRIYLYDFNNNRPIVDYYLDGTSNTANPKKSKLVFDGNLNTDAVTKKGTTYKFRITNHIRNLLKYADSTNVKLGLVVAEDINVNSVASYKLKTPNAFISQAPKASVMNPLGTVLFSGTSIVAEDKRLKLEIYYTKPN